MLLLSLRAEEWRPAIFHSSTLNSPKLDVRRFGLIGRLVSCLFFFRFFQALLELAHPAAKSAKHLRNLVRAEEQNDDHNNGDPEGRVAPISQHVKHSRLLPSSTRRRLRPRAPRQSRR